MDNSNKIYGPIYHGGKWNGISPIKMNRGSLGTGAYFTPDINRAKNYAEESSGKVIQAYLLLENPFLLEYNRDENIGSPLVHPCVKALVQLGVPLNKAASKVEKVEEDKGYLGKEISTLAIKQGYDSLLFVVDGVVTEVVIWNSKQVSMIVE